MSQSAPEPVERWPLLEQARAWPALGSFPSRGHVEQSYTVEIRVSPSAVSLYRNLVADSRLPAGSVLVAFHRVAEKPGPIYVMEKRQGGWAFLELNRRGEPRVGTKCVGCHAEAAHDSVFGLPRTSE